MFLRSIVKFGVKYLNYIGDGESKTFADILKMIPYGEDRPVTKNECVGHVQKRIGTRLRNKRKAESRRKSSVRYPLSITAWLSEEMLILSKE